MEKKETRTTQQEIVIYNGKDGEVKLNADFRNETIWATHQQIADIFGIDRSGITKHINKIIFNGEVDKKSNVQNLHIANSDRPVAFYSLDIILSVGYRVNSTKAIEFRKWANSVLKEYLLKGVIINQSRLDQLNKTIEIISRSYIPEISGIASILQNYTKGLNLLDNYDHQKFSKPKTKNKDKWQLTYKEARKFIDSMNFGKESSLFGREKDDSFKSSLGAIYQTFDGKELYPSVQEKAANLLYLIVKNHSFTDGNKRIAAALFVYFLDKNKALKSKIGQPLIDNNALAATTLMIALSKPQEKDIMCSLVVNFISSL
jgi:prophage maintenance system killer protein/prophage antirepressor-like protein